MCEEECALLLCFVKNKIAHLASNIYGSYCVQKLIGKLNKQLKLTILESLVEQANAAINKNMFFVLKNMIRDEENAENLKEIREKLLLQLGQTKKCRHKKKLVEFINQRIL